MSPERVSVGEEGQGHSMLMDQKQKKKKSAGTNSGESGARNLEAGSIGSRAESTGGCVKLKTVTEIRLKGNDETYLSLHLCLGLCTCCQGL